MLGTHLNPVLDSLFLCSSVVLMADGEESAREDRENGAAGEEEAD
jgi:hypothetical protein